MVSKLHRVATGRLDTGVGQQSNDDDVSDAVLFQLLIKVRVRESTLTPVLFDYYIAVLRRKIRMPFSAPCSARETMASHDGNLSWVGMAPGFIVSRLPTTMGHDENGHAGTAYRGAYGP